MAVRLWGVVVAAALVAPLSGTVAEAASADDAATATVTGTVWMDRDGDGGRDAGEPALGALAVSEGLQVVRTAKDGGYSLALDVDVDHRLTDIVAVALPSGCRVPLSATRSRAIGTWINSSAAPTGNLVLVGAYDSNVYGLTG